LEVVRFLRTHCPWDRRQTPRSLVRYLLEEAAETASAIRSGDAAAMEDELGDLLLNVAFQIVIAEEEGSFSAESVVRGLERKMKRRHPDLFAGGSPRSWNEIKAAEAAASHGTARPGGGETPGASPEHRASLMDTLPSGLEPLLRAYRLQRNAAQVGFDWPDIEGPLAKLSEEARELQGALETGDPSATREEVGDLLFTLVNIARRLGIHPEAALDEASDKFEARFRGMERLAVDRAIRLEDVTLDDLEELWQESKGWTRGRSDPDGSPPFPERGDSAGTASGSGAEARDGLEP
jgi:MazG family protein